MSTNTIIAFVISFLLSSFFLYTLIGFSVRNNLLDRPNERRKLHTKAVSNLGGIAIFVGTMFPYFVFSDYSNVVRPDKLFSIVFILFFIGLKDDIEPIRAKIKFGIELFCSFFIVYFTDVRLLNLYGIFGIHELTYWYSFILTSLYIVFCINAYNMIDGIDGLLGVLSLLAAILFGVIFAAADQWLWTLLCVALSGSLISFLLFNWQPAKIFMGDGGSMFIGTFFACISLKVMQLNAIESPYFTITMPHVITLGIIAIPTIDIILVVLSRLLSGGSPLKADNRHIHYRLLGLGLKHWQATLILVAINLGIIVFAYEAQSEGALKSLIYTFLLSCSLLYAITLLSLKYHKPNINDHKIKELPLSKVWRLFKVYF